MTTKPASPALTRFIRQTLGCGCPPEVFEQVADDQTRISNGAGIRRRIDVGGRLLIYLVEPRDTERALSELPVWIDAGRRERDDRGMNRLRLVLALDAPSPRDVAALERTFAESAQGDERLHLHILAPDACPTNPESAG